MSEDARLSREVVFSRFGVNLQVCGSALRTSEVVEMTMISDRTEDLSPNPENLAMSGEGTSSASQPTGHSFENIDKGSASLSRSAASRSAAQDADTEIFNRFLAGNDDAFRALYDAYERPLYLYVLRLVGSAADAEDLFQEIWTKMFRLRDNPTKGMGDSRTVKRFSGLLFTIARNLSINAIRDRKLLPDLTLDESPAEFESLARSHMGDDSDMRDMIERALMQLPLAQREAFVLREYFGYSYQEVADIMGTPMVTAKTRAWRGRERLRKMISAWMDLQTNDE